MTRGERVIAFIEKYCKVPEGSKVGQNIELVEFQRKFILEVFDNPNGTSVGILSLARKNGKTALIACIVLAFLVGPEARLNTQLVSGALSRDQAALVFNLASKMIQLSDELSKIIRVIPSGKRLIGLPMNTEYKALAADGRTAHGLSPFLAILDEVGQVKGPQSDFVDAITTSQGAHEKPLMLVISTQAPTDADLLSVWIDDAERSGDKSIVSHVYTAKEDCELGDEKAWHDANPAMGFFRSKEDIEKQAVKAERMPTNEAAFRVLILNQRVNMTSPFVSARVWKENSSDPLPFDDLVYGGLDLSATTDLTSLVLVNRVDGEVSVQPYFWMPLDSVVDASKRDRAPYDVWVKQGLIRTTPGRVIDYAFVARDIAEITQDMDIASIAFDRWRMDRLQAEFERGGIELPLEPFGQGYVSMSPALDALEELLLKNQLRHGGNAPLTMCASNAVALPDPAGNRKLDKSKATGRIDGMVALAMAVGIEAKDMNDNLVSPWDDPDFRLIA